MLESSNTFYWKQTFSVAMSSNADDKNYFGNIVQQNDGGAFHVF